jgi:hypothetical protein
LSIALEQFALKHWAALLHVEEFAMMSPLDLTIDPPSMIQETAPSLVLLDLIGSSEIESLRSLLHQPPQAVEQLEQFASKSDLRRFVQWALQQSYSPALTLDEKLQLLDIAWNIQELLWASP